MKIKNITIFCGARTGDDSIYEESAFALGAALAEKGIGIVYGGGAIGLMGAVADGALSKGGHVKGVIPQFLVDREMAHPHVQEMEVVGTMHERKAVMESSGDAILTLPGGAGTFEEFFEVFTWGQIGLHQKPIGLLNISGFFTELMQLLNAMIDKSFLQEKYLDQLFISSDVDEILEGFNTFKPVEIRSYEQEKRRRLQ